MKVSMRFEGGEALSRALSQLPDRVGRRMKQAALSEAAEPMRVRMSELAPHEPGKPDLRDAMVVRPSRGQDRDEQAVAVGPSRAGFYGLFQEYGTIRHAAQPFARPAFDGTARHSLTVLRTALWAALTRRGHGRQGPSTGGGLL